MRASNRATSLTECPSERREVVYRDVHFAQALEVINNKRYEAGNISKASLSITSAYREEQTLKPQVANAQGQLQTSTGSRSFLTPHAARTSSSCARRPLASG
jgi:hypothetical protein